MSDTVLTPRKLISGMRGGHKAVFVTEIPGEIEVGNCNYRRPNMDMDNSNDTDNGHLKDVNMMLQ